MITLDQLFSHPWLPPLGWTLLHFLWQGALVAALLAAALRLLRHTAATWRYLTACAALLLMAACPAVTLGLLMSTPPTSPAQPGGRLASSIPAIVFPLSSRLNARTPERLNASDPAQSAGRWQPAHLVEPLLPWLVASWLSGVLLLSLRLLGSWAAVQRLKRRGTRPITGALPARLAELARRMGIARPVLLRESALVETPAVIGAVRAVILLPVSALSGLTPAQLEALLIHELAHIRRHDYLVNLLQTALETLLFYHPAVWWASHCIRVEREHCCDDLAVAALGDRITYARALTALEALRSAPGALAMAGNGGDLLARIQRILGRPSPQPGPAAGWLGGTLMTALLLAAAAAVHLSAAGSPLLNRAEDRLIAAPALSTTATVRSEHTLLVHHWLRHVHALINRPLVGPPAGDLGTASASRRRLAAKDPSEGSLLVISSSERSRSDAAETRADLPGEPPPAPKAPAAPPSAVAPLAQPALPIPAAKPRPPTPAAQPHLPTPFAQPKQPAPAAQPLPPAPFAKPGPATPWPKPAATAATPKPRPFPATVKPPSPAPMPKAVPPAPAAAPGAPSALPVPKPAVAPAAPAAPTVDRSRVRTPPSVSTNARPGPMRVRLKSPGGAQRTRAVLATDADGGNAVVLERGITADGRVSIGLAFTGLPASAVATAKTRVATAQPPKSAVGAGSMALLGGLGGGGIVKGGGSKRYQDVGVLDLRGVPARQVAQIERIHDVGVILLDEGNRNALRAAVEDVGATVVAKPGLRVMVEPFLEISKATLEGMPAGQSLLLVGIVLFKPDVPPALVAQKFASLEVVGILLSSAQLQGALLGKMQLTGIQANLPDDAGPVVHSVGANKLTQNYLSRLQDNVVYVSIGVTTVEKDVTEAMLQQKIRTYCNIGVTNGPTRLTDVLKARAAANIGVFSDDDEKNED